MCEKIIHSKQVKAVMTRDIQSHIISDVTTLPNIGGALCSTPQSLADAHYKSAV